MTIVREAVLIIIRLFAEYPKSDSSHQHRSRPKGQYKVTTANVS